MDFTPSQSPLKNKEVRLCGHELATKAITPKMIDQGIDITTSQVFADKIVIGDLGNSCANNIFLITF